MAKRHTTKLDARTISEMRRKRSVTEKNIGMAIEDWRAKKRQEWKEVVRALDRFRFGCAYTPISDEVYHMDRAVARANEAMSEDWICW